MLRSDTPIVLLSALACVLTCLLLVTNIVWLALTLPLRRRGGSVTRPHHDWTKAKGGVTGVHTDAERRKYQRWFMLLRFSYAAWCTVMALFVILTFLVCD